MSIRITTLIEDSLSENPLLQNEQGLSFFIETENKKQGQLLFDTGQSRKFIDNALRLGIDLATTDKIVLSHGHYDHSGGFKDYVETFGHDFELYVGDGFFNEKYARTDGGWKYLGNNFDKAYLKEKRIHTNILKKDMTMIIPGVYALTNFPRTTPFEKNNEKYHILKGSNYEVDQFTDEVVLVLETKAGLVVLLGCSHPGLINILKTIQDRLNQTLYFVLGGTHLVGADEERLAKTIECLSDMDIFMLGISHCTGSHAQSCFIETKKEFFLNTTGARLEFA